MCIFWMVHLLTFEDNFLLDILTPGSSSAYVLFIGTCSTIFNDIIKHIVSRGRHTLLCIHSKVYSILLLYFANLDLTKNVEP